MAGSEPWHVEEGHLVCRKRGQRIVAVAVIDDDQAAMNVDWVAQSELVHGFQPQGREARESVPAAECDLRERLRSFFASHWLADEAAEMATDAVLAVLPRGSRADRGWNCPWLTGRGGVMDRPWRFEVDCESHAGGSMAGEDPTDPEAWWTWAIFDGPTDPDDLVLCGVTDTGDPTPVLEQIVARHNAAQPQGMEGAQGLTHHDSGRFGRAPVPTPGATRRGPSAADSLEPQGRVLWQGKTGRQLIGADPVEGWSRSWVQESVPVPPGTEVAVVVLGDSHGDAET